MRALRRGEGSEPAPAAAPRRRPARCSSGRAGSRHPGIRQSAARAHRWPAGGGVAEEELLVAGASPWLIMTTSLPPVANTCELPWPIIPFPITATLCSRSRTANVPPPSDCDDATAHRHLADEQLPVFSSITSHGRSQLGFDVWAVGKSLMGPPGAWPLLRAEVHEAAYEPINADSGPRPAPPPLGTRCSRQPHPRPRAPWTCRR